jgi:hypothetical protein
MAIPTNVPGALATGPFRGSEAVRSGLVTRRRLESGAWHRLFRDVYIHEAVDLSHLTRCRAIALVLPRGADVSGASAAHLLGADIVGPGAPVEVTVPRELRMPRHPGVVTSYSELRAEDVVYAHGVPRRRRSGQHSTSREAAAWTRPSSGSTR